MLQKVTCAFHLFFEFEPRLSAVFAEPRFRRCRALRVFLTEGANSPPRGCEPAARAQGEDKSEGSADVQAARLNAARALRRRLREEEASAGASGADSAHENGCISPAHVGDTCKAP